MCGVSVESVPVYFIRQTSDWMSRKKVTTKYFGAAHWSYCKERPHPWSALLKSNKGKGKLI